MNIRAAFLSATLLTGTTLILGCAAPTGQSPQIKQSNYVEACSAMLAQPMQDVLKAGDKFAQAHNVSIDAFKVSQGLTLKTSVEKECANAEQQGASLAQAITTAQQKLAIAKKKYRVNLEREMLAEKLKTYISDIDAYSIWTEEARNNSLVGA